MLDHIQIVLLIHVCDLSLQLSFLPLSRAFRPSSGPSAAV